MRMLRIGIAAAGLLLVLASRLPWFTVDVEAMRIDDVSLLGNEVAHGLVGYRVESDRFVLALLGALIALTAGVWAWRVATLLARPLLMLFAALAMAWSTLALFEADTIPSASNAAEGMTASVGPVVCLVLSAAIFAAAIVARLAASDLPAIVAALGVMLDKGRMPAAVVLSRRLLDAVQRARGPGHPETVRAATTHVMCLLSAGFPEDAHLVLQRLEARPELGQDSEAAEAVQRMRGEVSGILGVVEP